MAPACLPPQEPGSNDVRGADASGTGRKLMEFTPLLLLTSPLGDDRIPFQDASLHAISLVAVERLSAPFEIALTVVSTDRAISPDELLYQPVTVTVRRAQGTDRIFNGIVRRMDAVGFAQRARFEYHLSVVPRLWFLDQTVDCRIFQRRTAVEILQLLFAEQNVTSVDFRIFGDKPVREYTTQFNETNLAFSHRLMQESGYFYFFEHSRSGHTLVVTNANQAFRTMTAPLHRVIYAGNNVDIFDAWRTSLGTAFGAVRLQDYDPTRPETPVVGEQTTTLSAAGASTRKLFQWPANTPEMPVAADRARFRMEAAEASASLRCGHGYNPNLCPGFRFSLAEDPSTGAENVEHVVQAVRHTASDETWIAGTEPPSFDCEFTCFQQTVEWRDDLSIARPAMTGIFSAIVLGEPGEEIHADSLARIKVRPLFDYRNDSVASMAIWVRILHAWSGKSWGWQHLPRVGTEIGLSFMNGDPDNPVVVGCFYNQEWMPPFPVPSQQTKQGFRSRSTSLGGTQDYNELSFDDRRGQEVVLLHAQRNHKIEVENDQASTIGNDRTVTTECDDSLTSTTGDISIAADAGAISLTATTSISLKVGDTTLEMTPGSITINTPELTVTTDALASISAGGALELSAIGAVDIQAGAAATLSAGAETAINACLDINIAAVGAVTIESLDQEPIVCDPFPI